MPPVSLLITRDGAVIRARLRLSGVERHGTVTANGNHIVIHFPGAADLSGELVATTQLRLDLDLPVRTTLRKMTP
jgi:hypothetical protein